jgi:hypothetical protein
MALKKPQRTYDWDALKLEWLGSGLSINQFAKFKGINDSLFYTSINADDWKKERKEITSRAIEKLKDRMSSDLSKKFSNFPKLWDGVRELCTRILVQYQDKEIIEPSEVERIANALEKTMKGTRLLDGESTENVHTENLHLSIVKIIEERQNDNPT